MRPLYTLLALALASAPALAQNNNQSTDQPNTAAREQLSNSQQTVPNRHNQKIERIVVEDAGSRVDELRVGGQTQSITVQPKTGTPLPAYEVRANDGARARPGNLGESDAIKAPRVWNLGHF